ARSRRRQPAPAPEPGEAVSMSLSATSADPTSVAPSPGSRAGARALSLLIILGFALSSLFPALPGAARAAEAPPQAPAAVIVGGDRDYPPYEFIDKDGRPAGYNVELTRAI